MKIQTRLISSISNITLMVILVVGFLIPLQNQTVAAATVDDLRSDVAKIAKLNAFKVCVNGGSGGGLTGQSGLSENLLLGENPPFFGHYYALPSPHSPLGMGGVSRTADFFATSDLSVSVGYIADSGNGQRTCGVTSHMDDWSKLIGYAGAKDFRDKNYTLDTGGYLSFDDHMKANGGIDALKKKVIGEIDAAIAKIDYTDAHRYVNAYESFGKCANISNRKSVREDLGANATILQVKNFITPSSRYIYEGGSGISYFAQTEADQVPVGHQDENDDGKMQCSTIASRLERYSANFKSWLDTNYADSTTSTSPDDFTDNPIQEVAVEDSCESKGGLLSWIMCPAINLLGSTLNWVDTQLTRLLEIDRNRYDTNDTGGSNLYRAWASFRNIGLTLLIAMMLVMIISTALGINAFDAYTVKKAMPRMIAAVIFMTLSWYICVFLVDLSNNIGRGVLGLMTAPFGSPASLTSLFSASGSGALAQGGAVAGLAIGVGVFAVSGGIGVLFGWLVPALTIMIIAFITLVARQLFILVLILFAPLAILSWIFPGNDKLWKFWWQSFSKLLMMFPIVMALIASSRIFAGVVAATGGSLIDTLLKLTAYIVPYIFIPFTFKAAGGAFGAVTGMLNDRSKGIFDRSRKMRHKGMENVGERAKSGNLMAGAGTNRLGRGIGKLNSAAQAATLIPKAGINPRNWASNMAAADTIEGRKEINDMLNDAAYEPFKDDDTLNLVAARWARKGGKSAQSLAADLKEAGYAGGNMADINKAAAGMAQIRNRMSMHSFDQMAVVQAIAGGTEFDGDPEKVWREVKAASHGNGAALASMVAKGRSAAMSAGRVAQGGGSFGDTLKFANGDINKEQFLEKVSESQGPGILLHPSMKPADVEMLMPSFTSKVDQGYAEVVSANQALQNAETPEQRAELQAAYDKAVFDFDSQLGMLNAVQDQVSMTSPNKAQEVIKSLSGKINVDGREMTYRELMQARSGTAGSQAAGRMMAGYAQNVQQQANASSNKPLPPPTSPNTKP